MNLCHLVQGSAALPQVSGAPVRIDFGPLPTGENQYIS